MKTKEPHPSEFTAIVQGYKNEKDCLIALCNTICAIDWLFSAGESDEAKTRLSRLSNDVSLYVLPQLINRE